MSENQQHSLFTELTDGESASVSGGSISMGISSANNNNSKTNNSSYGVNMLFFLPQPNQLYLYDPSRDRTYPTLVV